MIEECKEVRASEAAQLGEAFSAFAEVAEQLQTAYQSLQLSATRLDQELAEANQQLKAQVVELENLSGSLAAVLRAIPCGVVVAGPDGTVLMMNPAAEEILDVKGERLLGENAARFQDAGGQPLLRVQEGPGDVEERTIQTAKGARFVDGRVVPVSDTNGCQLGLVEVLSDRSEIKALQLEVERLDGLAELGRVAAIIAHEIRNPLSGIRGFAGMLERFLKEEDGCGKQLRWTRKIVEGVERADAIIDSVLFLARPNPLRRERIDAEAFLCDTFELVAQADPNRTRGVHVSLEVNPGGLVVLADRTRLQQALSNLMQNALESLEGKGRLELRAEQVKKTVEFVVRDSGPGVPDEARERLFEAFFTTRTEGAGLGLALVQRIAELHGGKVMLRPGIGSGASFVLALPAMEVPQEACAQ
ncbi:MAG: ATP-binding protein [Planctomycetota bacterium]